jgi:hypothetical protein
MLCPEVTTPEQLSGNNDSAVVTYAACTDVVNLVAVTPSPPTMTASFFSAHPLHQPTATPPAVLLLIVSQLPPPLPLSQPERKPLPPQSMLSADSMESTTWCSSKSFMCLVQTGVIARAARRTAEWNLMAHSNYWSGMGAWD